MAITGKLTAAKVRTAREGMHGDGGGLWLSVKRGGRSWMFRYKSPVTGRERQMGLGSLDVVSLAEAREKATECRKLLADKRDPLDESRTATARSEAEAITFRAAAERYIEDHSPGWRNEKHRAQWGSSLAAYAYPFIGDMPVGKVDTDAVMRVLQPIWQAKPETATRLRGRIELVLDAAKIRGWRAGENPARWRGHLAHLLPARAKLRPVKHHAALPWADLPLAMHRLSERGGVAPLALRFLILTAARSGEARGALWSEIDVPGATWTIPAERMKAGRVHRVPLSAPAVAILTTMDDLRQAEGRSGGLVFPGQARGKPLSDVALSTMLQRVAPGVTIHGFRSTFRDWCAECSPFPREVAEQALAHVLENKVEAAYRRSDLIDKRRELMDEWGRFCSSAGGSGADSAVDDTPALAAERAR